MAKHWGDLPLALQLGSLACAGVASGVIASSLSNRWLYYDLSAFINPEAFSDIAAQLPANEQDYILAAWEMAGEDLDYRLYGSVLYFGEDKVQCKSVSRPAKVFNRGWGNCVAKSQVLTSILRNRFSPSDTYLAVGTLAQDGIGGHAWVTVRSEGVWYVLESTLPPPDQPWLPAAKLSHVYSCEAYVNDTGLVCMDEEVCKLIHHANLIVDRKDPRQLLCKCLNPHHMI